MQNTDLIVSVLAAGAAIFLVIVESGLAILSLYLLIITIASCHARPRATRVAHRVHRIAILIPAHNEELLLGTLIRSLKRVDYPSDHYDIHVAADNCTDATATVGREAGAEVHERIDPSAPGKAHALNWLTGRLLAPRTGSAPYDAFIVLDADSSVSPSFLREINARLCEGHMLVQGFNDVSNPVESWTASLRYIAFCLICYLRPLGKSALGLSAGLFGNGMCLGRAVVEQFPWNPESPSEDHELHMRLLSAGMRVVFAPDAHVYSQMPGSLRTARSQNVRWERGKIELMRRHSPGLLVGGIRDGDWSRIAGALELMIPPFSVAFGLTAALFGASLLVGSLPAICLGLFNLGAQLLYTARGLAIMPMHSGRLYLALLWAPWFIVWKAGVYLAVAFGDGRGQWVRTARSVD